MTSSWDRRYRASAASVRDRAGDAVQLAKDNPLEGRSAWRLCFSAPKTGRNIAGNALAIGGLAAIAGLGYQAYKNYQAGQAPAAPSDAPPPSTPVLLPPPADSGFGPASPAGSNEFALVLIRAMIAAAKADGHIDDAERAHVMDKVKAADVSGEAASFIEHELASPTDLDALVAAATTEEQKRRALHRLAADDRAGLAGRTRLSRSSCRPSWPCRCACGPHRSNGFLRQGFLVTVTCRLVAFARAAGLSTLPTRGVSMRDLCEFQGCPAPEVM